MRTGHAAMEVFLILNEQEQVTLAIASGNLPRDSPVEWLHNHTNAY
jgi:hypothetical protein